MSLHVCNKDAIFYRSCTFLCFYCFDSSEKQCTLFALRLASLQATFQMLRVFFPVTKEEVLHIFFSLNSYNEVIVLTGFLKQFGSHFPLAFYYFTFYPVAIWLLIQVVLHIYRNRYAHSLTCKKIRSISSLYCFFEFDLYHQNDSYI